MMNPSICLQSIHTLKLGYCKTLCISRFCFVLPSHKSIYVTVVRMKPIHGTAKYRLDDDVKVTEVQCFQQQPREFFGRH
jgi:hypothetical protein